MLYAAATKMSFIFIQFAHEQIHWRLQFSVDSCHFVSPPCPIKGFTVCPIRVPRGHFCWVSLNPHVSTISPLDFPRSEEQKEESLLAAGAQGTEPTLFFASLNSDNVEKPESEVSCTQADVVGRVRYVGHLKRRRQERIAVSLLIHGRPRWRTCPWRARGFRSTHVHHAVTFLLSPSNDGWRERKVLVLLQDRAYWNVFAVAHTELLKAPCNGGRCVPLEVSAACIGDCLEVMVAFGTFGTFFVLFPVGRTPGFPADVTFEGDGGMPLNTWFAGRRCNACQHARTWLWSRQV